MDDTSRLSSAVSAAVSALMRGAEPPEGLRVADSQDDLCRDTGITDPGRAVALRDSLMAGGVRATRPRDSMAALRDFQANAWACECLIRAKRAWKVPSTHLPSAAQLLDQSESIVKGTPAALLLRATV